MKGHTILVVDDNPVNLKLVADLLEYEGYVVQRATDAEQAITALEVSRPELILMDIGLPGMDGLTLTKQLKSQPHTRDILVIALTAFAMKGDEERARVAGCDGYIIKPINTRTIGSAIEGFLKHRMDGEPGA